MISGGMRLAAIGGAALALAGAEVAAAHGFPHWTGTKGPFAWEARLLSCGAVAERPSRVRAHTRWSTSPANGYTRLTFERQRRNGAGKWVVVQRQRRSTKNTPLEGNRRILHWTQGFMPFAGDGGERTRHIVVFEWIRDRVGRDHVALRRSFTSRICAVGA